MKTIKYKSGFIEIEKYNTIAKNIPCLLISAHLKHKSKTNCKTLIGAKRWITKLMLVNQDWSV